MNPPIPHEGMAYLFNGPSGSITAYWGVITQVFGQAGPPSGIRYSAKAINTASDIQIINRLPTGRTTDEGEIAPAVVGDLCIIQVCSFGGEGPPLRLYVLSEKILGDACTAGVQEDTGGSFVIRYAESGQ